MGTGF